ncbi:MAG TPA: FimV/HubP family polar landmark protein, partial [Thermomonas sp.]|nr:FimV/HubP family polar landmark protein [Thermomonas sp.]
RPAEPAPVVVPPPAPARPVPPPAAVAVAPAPAPIAAEPLPPPVTVPPLPPPTPTPVVAAPAPAPVVAPRPAAETPARYGPVRQGETLSNIVGKLDLPGGYSLDQAMLALLRANPDAFLGDDVNRLKRGAVLRVPGSGEIATVSADEAALVVREQMAQWRQARRPVAQPEATPVAEAAPTRAAPPAPKPAATAPAPAAKSAVAKPAPPPARRQQAQARLEIVPPSAPGKATGTRSGTTAGGEGSMLQQQLRQKDEDIAAKSAEIGDLKERVAELENLRQQQQQLLAMKDSELAAAQQRLADARKAAAAAPAMPAATPATQAAQSTQVAEAPRAANTTPWLWGGLAFVGMALLAWLFVRRQPKAPQKAPARRGFDSEALAASMVAPTLDDAPRDEAVDTAGIAPATTTVDLDDVPATPAARSETPNWHSGWVKSEAPTPPLAEPAQPRFVPVAGADAETDIPAPPKASADQRMKLARAFLDIGDDHSARELLRELLDDVDPAARTEAARLLRELG